MSKENKEIKTMLVDDHAIMRNLLESTLRGMDITKIILAKNAEEALRSFHKRKPDLVFLDINMPDKSGIEVLKEMLSIHPDTFITMVTGENTMDNVKKSISNGAKGFVVKPYTTEKIISILKKYNTT